MIIDKLPKIIKIEGGESPLESKKIVLDNHRVATFILENVEENELNVKVKAYVDDAEDSVGEYIPFLIKENNVVDFENVTDEGANLIDEGLFLVTINADSLGRNEYDRISIELTSGQDIDATYAFLTQPRYSDNE